MRKSYNILDRLKNNTEKKDVRSEGVVRDGKMIHTFKHCEWGRPH